MTDPLSLVVLGATAGAAAGKFVEKAWDAGEKWLASYFSNHRDRAQDEARKNAANFVSELGRQIDDRTASAEVSAAQVEQAQDHPEFSATLKQAILSAAQTESEEKHRLLARLVTERLSTGADSTLAVASKMACDAIAFATTRQLHVLGLQTNILHIQPLDPLPAQSYTMWLNARLLRFADLSASHIDYIHLEAISCATFQPFMGRDLAQILRDKNRGDFDDSSFRASPRADQLFALWDNGLQSLNLTSVGQLIGIFVADAVCGGRTRIAGWGA